MLRNRNKAHLIRFWIVLLATAVHGCGGHGSKWNETASTTGRITLTVTWPSSRAIPAEARSLRLTAKVLEPADGPQVGEIVVQRPEGQSTSQVVMNDLPSVKVRLTATAHASGDGTGAALASGSAEVKVLESNSVAASISLQANTDCVMPRARVFVSAVGDDGNAEQTIDAEQLTASATRQSSFTVGKTFEDPGETVTTSATANLNRALLKGVITNYGRYNALFVDTLVIDAPGKTGQAGQATVVMQAERPSFGGATSSTYTYLLKIGSAEYDVHGVVTRGVQSGQPAPDGEVPITFQFVYGQPFSFQSELDFSFNILEPPSTSEREAEWNYIRIDGLPAGATITSKSCDDWPTEVPI